jgi:DNA (cytosine-5)-methyltransferase 1
MNHISLFSGIGGFDLASEWMGWNNIASCEINPFGRKVLNHYWPDALHHNDVHTFTKELLNEKIKNWNSNDLILTGGFPCQPYSVAGKRKGTEDDRHLWPEMLRVIQEVQPRWIVGENVRGLVNWNGGVVFDEVQFDLETIGYEVQSFILPACSKNAPHRRDRLWIVAYSDGANKGNDVGTNERTAKKIRGENAGNVSFKFSSVGNVTDSDGEGSRGMHKAGEKESGFNRETSFSIGFENFPTKSPICGGNDGISFELDGITFPKWRNESIKAYGNAVVPQVVFEIFKTIEKYEQQIKT